MLTIIKAVDYHFATVSLKGHANDLQLQIYLMMSTVYLQKEDETLLKTKYVSCVKKRLQNLNFGMLHMMMDLDKRLNKCARNLNDIRLMTRLSGGDIIAQELKYHCSCLTTLYNRERAHLLSQSNQEKMATREKEANPIVFSELLVYIIESKIGIDRRRKQQISNLYTMDHSSQLTIVNSLVSEMPR